MWKRSLIIICILIGIVGYLSIKQPKSTSINIEQLRHIDQAWSWLPEWVPVNREKNDTQLFKTKSAWLKDFNKFTGKQYTRRDLKDFNKNAEVVDWYINQRIPDMLRASGNPVNIRNVMIAYCEGISHVIYQRGLKQDTMRRIREYSNINM